jgi:pimeloyl-ACP methyl ester carboxylesterase
MKYTTILGLSIILHSILCLTNAHRLKAGKIKVEKQGVYISYADEGNGDTTLLFVHGWCLNKSYWSNQVIYFRKKYRVVTIDLPGFGLSGKNRTDWSTANFAKDVDAVINQLHLKHVILIGHSMAGDIVLQAALNSPKQVIGLVGVDNFKAVGQLPTQQQIKNNLDGLQQMQLHFKQVATQYFNQSLFYTTTSPAIRKRILNDVAKSDSLIAVSSLQGAVQQMRFDESTNLLRYKKKLYLINSDYTPTDTTALTAKHIPHKIFYIHATGHFPMIEKPDDFNRLLSSVLKDN